MAANFVPQSMLYNNSFGNMANAFRDRSAEQANSQTNVPQFNYGFDPYQASNLGRYTPPMLSNPMSGANQWNDFGGYSYNLPNSFGSPYSNSYNMFGQIGGFPQAPMTFGQQYGGGQGGWGNGAQIGQMQQQPRQIPQFNFGAIQGQSRQALPPSRTNPFAGVDVQGGGAQPIFRRGM